MSRYISLPVYAAWSLLSSVFSYWLDRDSGYEVSEGSKPVLGFPDGSVGKESPCRGGAAGDAGPIPGQGRHPGGGQGDPLQCSGREKPWTEELQAMESQSQTCLKRLRAPTHTNPSCLLWFPQL